MNRADLVDKVRASTNLSRADSEAAVSAVLQTVMTSMRDGERVSLFGFGTFLPSSRAARTGRNPRTGDPVKIPASTGVRFTPSTAFKASLNPKKAAKKSSGRSAAATTAAPAEVTPTKAAKASKPGKADKPAKAAAAKAAPTRKAPAKGGKSAPSKKR
ncbi:MAG: HU family DNA-binding protein [Acidimicrobiales bacterium]